MKVIAAGYGKTGTKTMNVALQQLGYSVHDSPDQFWFHEKEWTKIMSAGEGGTIEDFKRMYQDVDAVVDAPASLFWEQIHEAFPDAKVRGILERLIGQNRLKKKNFKLRSERTFFAIKFAARGYYLAKKFA